MSGSGKALLRRQARTRRARLGVAERAAASSALRGHLAAFLERFPKAALAGYWPLGGEVDLRPLLADWHGAGRVALLPRVVAPKEPLRFHRWTPDMILEPARYGVEEPPAASPALRPDIVLVPALAVDAAGYRLGYGGGFYDRTLAEMTPLAAIGIAFAAQRIECLPRDPFDQRLTHLCTEEGLMAFPIEPVA
ncbi:MAG: 5-formyltetrahydrofolate cyclo-ligase [Geminicoccaceae bacterium]|nr:MAG: 5-formyltetrahydrofolate cyclo-ligase [Geminicoccaceae bacterium]